MTKILIVEDERPLREALRDKLTREGYQVIEAGDGEEGLVKAKQEQPVLILTDIMMPKMDGFALMQALRNDDDLKSIPVVVVSNLGQEEDKQRAKELGAKDFFIKADMPVADLTKYIHSLLSQ